MRLRLREIHGNVTVTPTTLTAWYVLSPQRWSFLTDAQREKAINSFAARLADLPGGSPSVRAHLRVTTRPYPAATWAEQLHDNTQNPLPAWGEYLRSTQRRLHSATLADKEVFLGVDLPRKRNPFQRTAATSRGCLGAMPEIAKRERELNRFADVVAGPGMEGREARTDEIEWLCHRSIRLGLPEPLRLSASPDQPWDLEDLAALTEGVTVDHEPFGKTVQINATHGGHTISRHVAVLSVGRMHGLDIPQQGPDPWMQHTDRLGFPVEWSSTFDILSGPEAGAKTAKKRLVIRDQQRHYARHDIEEPLDLERKASLARRIEDETLEGEPIVATRCYGWHRIAVAAEDEETCLRRAQAVIDSYSGNQRISIMHPTGVGAAANQRGLLREFSPGEKISSTAYMRRLPARYLAAGMPHVTASVGDRRGPYIGTTSSGAVRAVMLDPHHAMEKAEATGLIPVVGTPGSGKSGLISAMVRDSVLRGITTTVLDPSGPMANLTRMPSLRDHARHLDLSQGEEGILNPYSVIGAPLTDNYDTEQGYQEACVAAFQNRKALALDVISMLLPPQFLQQPQTPLVISNAIRAVGGERDGSLWQVIKQLDQAHDEHATNAANYLRDAADMPQSRLFFPNHHRDLGSVSDDTLLVLTMHGLQLPDENVERSLWSSTERMSVPLLHLASHYATARAYGMERQQRKMIALDEAGMVARWGSGRALFTNLGRDSRKWNIATLVASQNPSDILGMNVSNLTSTAFVGLIEDEDVAREALSILRIKPDVGYEATIASLSPQITGANGTRRRGSREFLMRDLNGNVERIRVDIHDPELLAAIDTTAAPIETVAS